MRFIFPKQLWNLVVRMRQTFLEHKSQIRVDPNLLRDNRPPVRCCIPVNIQNSTKQKTCKKLGSLNSVKARPARPKLTKATGFQAISVGQTVIPNTIKRSMPCCPCWAGTRLTHRPWAHGQPDAQPRLVYVNSIYIYICYIYYICIVSYILYIYITTKKIKRP